MNIQQKLGCHLWGRRCSCVTALIWNLSPFMSEHPLPPLPPDALEQVHTGDEGAIAPQLASLELSRTSPELTAQIDLVTAHLDQLSMPTNAENALDSNRPPTASFDAESTGHESNGGRSSRELQQSPRKLTKPMRKEVPPMDEISPPPRVSSKSQSQQGHGSPTSSQELNPNLVSPRPRPPRIAPLEEPINQRPRSQYPDQSAPSISSQSHQLSQQQYSYSQQWPQQYPDREYNPQDPDGFYGNTAMPPYARHMSESPVYAQSDAMYVTPAPMLDQSHLQPGIKAALLSNEQSLALYRANAKKSSNPDVVFEFAAFMLEASKSIVVSPADATVSNQLEIEKTNEKREGYVREAMQLLKRIADRGHVLAQYTLADCFSNGIGTPKARQDFDRAFPLFVAAAKHNHVDAAYRAGACCEYGWGCRKESAKAAHFYRAAASQKHPGAMFRLGQAEMNGELGLSKNPKEGITWLKRSAENATAEFPHALHELALCHEKGVPNVVFVDLDYSAELLGKAAELGYAPSAFRLGECYEYGTMGCQADPALSIHYYVS
jgi:TPR repeat protein